MSKTVGKLPPQMLNVPRKDELEERNKKMGPKGPKGDPDGKGKCKKAPETKATPSVIDFSQPRSLDREIYVLCGGNLRNLRGG